jgi:hypothetical protein
LKEPTSSSSWALGVYFGGGIMIADFFVWSSYAKSMRDCFHRRSHKKSVEVV